MSHREFTVVIALVGGLLSATGLYACILYDRSMRIHQHTAYMNAAVKLVQAYSNRYSVASPTPSLARDS